jgi:hypothetical protein
MASFRLRAAFVMFVIILLEDTAFSQSCNQQCGGSLVQDEIRIVQTRKEQIAWMLEWTKENFENYKAHLDQLNTVPVAKQLVQNSLNLDYESFKTLIEQEKIKYFRSDERTSDYLHKFTKDVQLSVWGTCMRSCFQSRNTRGIVAWATSEGPSSMQLTIGYLGNSDAAASAGVSGSVEGGTVISPKNVGAGELLPPNFRINRGDFKNVVIRRMATKDITVHISPDKDVPPDSIISLGPRPAEADSPSKPEAPAYGDMPGLKVKVKPYGQPVDEEGAESWAGIGPRGTGVHFEYISFRFEPSLPNLKLKYWCSGFHNAIDTEIIKSPYFTDAQECSPGLDNTNERLGTGRATEKIRITKFAVELDGTEKRHYEVIYECYSPNYGTLKARNGDACGTEKRDFITGIRITVKAKESSRD